MVIRRLGVWSVAKLYATISAAFGLFIGLCVAAVSALGAGLSRNTDLPLPAAFLGLGALIAAPIFYAVIGLISGAIGAGLYNLFAGMVGGIEMEIQQ